jgi:hypothetical protein
MSELLTEDQKRQLQQNEQANASAAEKQVLWNPVGTSNTFEATDGDFIENARFEGGQLIGGTIRIRRAPTQLDRIEAKLDRLLKALDIRT